jgi:ribosomal protein L16/L10AE
MSPFSLSLAIFPVSQVFGVCGLSYHVIVKNFKKKMQVYSGHRICSKPLVVVKKNRANSGKGGVPRTATDIPKDVT